MDALYTRLFWMGQGEAGRAAQPELRPALARFGAIFVDCAWAIPDEHGPTARLVGAAGALFRLEAVGAGWASPEARDFLADALEELQVWAAGLR